MNTSPLRAAPDDPTPRILANQAFGVHPLALRVAERWTESGMPGDEVRERALDLINRAFDIIEQGLGCQRAATAFAPCE